MLDDKLNILQVVGYQNSGKTTLIEKLCQLADEEEMQLGCFKHHGHGGKPDRLFKQKIRIDMFKRVHLSQVWRRR